MSEVYKRELVFVIAAVVAITMVLNFFFVNPSLKSVAGQIQIWALIIQLIAIGLGAVNLMRVHFRRFQRREEGRWFYSIWLIGLFSILTILGLINLATGTENPFYKWVFDHVYVSLGTTLYAITGFYIFSAAYRAFRARNLDAAILLIGGCFVILTNAPIGEVIWSGIPVIGRWMLDYGQVPAMRTFLITGAFGLMAYGFRTLLGKERGFYGEVAE
jgi:hypothetical protein